jgi:YVTN family beta-propeller protein
MMGYSCYVGRVGALAIALGVGFAIASAQGIAWADDTSSAPSDTSGTSAPPSDDGGTATDAAPTGADDSATGSPSSSTRFGPKKSPPQMVISNTGGAHSSSRPSRSPDGADEDTSAGNTDRPSATAKSIPQPRNSASVTAADTLVEDQDGAARGEASAPRPPQSTQPLRDRRGSATTAFTLASEPQAAPSPPNDVARLATRLRPTVTDSGAPLGAVEDLVAAAKDVAGSLAAHESTLAIIDTTPTPLAQPAPTKPPATNVGIGVLALLGLAPLATDSPQAPPEAPPTAWMALAAIRRQQQQDLLKRAPRAEVDATGTTLVDDTETMSLTASNSLLTTALAAPSADAVTASPTVLATIPVGVNPSGVAVSPDGSRLYVANQSDGTVSVIDTATNTVVGEPIPVVVAPYAVAVSPDGSRVYVTSLYVGPGGTVSVIDTATNTTLGDPIDVGGSYHFGVAVSPDGSRVYVTNGVDNTVSVIDTATNTVVGDPIPVGSSPVAVAVSPDGSRVYVANQFDNTVSVIDTATNTVVGDPIPVGLEPSGVAVSPDGSRVYVANQTGNTVSVIDTATNTVVGDPIPVGDLPHAVAVSSDGSRVYVTNFFGATVSVIDTATNTVVGDPIPVGTHPLGVAVSPDGSRLYVANQSDGTVSVIDTGTTGSGGGGNTGGGGTGNGGGGSSIFDIFLNPINGAFSQIASLGSLALDVIGDVGRGSASILSGLFRIGGGLVGSAFSVVDGFQKTAEGKPVSAGLSFLAGLTGATTVGLAVAFPPAAAPIAVVGGVTTAVLAGAAWLTSSFFGI